MADGPASSERLALKPPRVELHRAEEMSFDDVFEPTDFTTPISSRPAPTICPQKLVKQEVALAVVHVASGAADRGALCAELRRRKTPTENPAMVRVGINGFGRIGRTTFRYAWEMPELEIVAVNELVGGAETAAYLCKFDSVHGTWHGHDIAAAPDGASFSVDGKKIAFSECEAFTDVDWKGLGVEIVIECTGVFLTTAALKPYLDTCGVKRVVVSAPVKEPSVLNVVVGGESRPRK